MEINLARLEPGLRAVVTEMDVPQTLRCRLRDFGVIPGTQVRICYRSPDGGVTALELRGTIVALRTCELKKIRVRLI